MTWPSSTDAQRGKVPEESLLFSSCPQITWLHDEAGIFIFSPNLRKYWLLAGLEADLWSWIVLGYSMEQMTRYIALIMDCREETAKQKVLLFLQYLVREQILEMPQSL